MSAVHFMLAVLMQFVNLFVMTFRPSLHSSFYLLVRQWIRPSSIYPLVYESYLFVHFMIK